MLRRDHAARSARAAAQALADELGVPLLGQVPLDEPLRDGADEGHAAGHLGTPTPRRRGPSPTLAERLPGVLRPLPAAVRIRKPLAVSS